MKNREIKFRVWTGSQMEYKVMAGFLGAFYVQGMDEKDAACMSPFNTKYFDTISVMQFTGLKDKNGNGIYEGDVITTSFGKGIIIWNEDVASFQYAYSAIGKGTAIGGRMTNTLYKHDEPKYEVIGNIHENAGLLAVAP